MVPRSPWIRLFLCTLCTPPSLVASSMFLHCARPVLALALVMFSILMFVSQCQRIIIVARKSQHSRLQSRQQPPRSSIIAIPGRSGSGLMGLFVCDCAGAGKPVATSAALCYLLLIRILHSLLLSGALSQFSGSNLVDLRGIRFVALSTHQPRLIPQTFVPVITLCRSGRENEGPHRPRNFKHRADAVMTSSLWTAKLPTPSG